MSKTIWKIEDNLLVLGSNESKIGLLYDYDIYSKKSEVRAFSFGNSQLLKDDVADILSDDEMLQIMHSSCNYCRKPIPLTRLNSIGVCDSCMKIFHDEISASADVAISPENEFYLRKNLHKWEGVIGFKSGKLENKRHILTDRLIFGDTESILVHYKKEEPKHVHLKELHDEFGDVVAQYDDGSYVSVILEKKGDFPDFKILGFYRFLKALFPAE